MTNAPDKPLLNRILPAALKQGDQGAFLTLYNDLHIKVFRFFLRRVLVNETARDLTQQCFIRLWQFRHTLSADHPLEKQVFVIAHSLLVNHFAQEYRRKKIFASTPPSEKAGGYTADTQASFEISEEVKAAIDVLPPVRRQILVLKTFHDFSNHDIALQMKISVKTVEDHITKAFRRMKEVMTLSSLPSLYLALHLSTHWHGSLFF